MCLSLVTTSGATTACTFGANKTDNFLREARSISAIASDIARAGALSTINKVSPTYSWNNYSTQTLQQLNPQQFPNNKDTLANATQSLFAKGAQGPLTGVPVASPPNPGDNVNYNGKKQPSDSSIDSIISYIQEAITLIGNGANQTEIGTIKSILDNSWQSFGSLGGYTKYTNQGFLQGLANTFDSGTTKENTYNTNETYQQNWTSLAARVGSFLNSLGKTPNPALDYKTWVKNNNPYDLSTVQNYLTSALNSWTGGMKSIADALFTPNGLPTFLQLFLAIMNYTGQNPDINKTYINPYDLSTDLIKQNLNTDNKKWSWAGGATNPQLSLSSFVNLLNTFFNFNNGDIYGLIKLLGSLFLTYKPSTTNVGDNDPYYIPIAPKNTGPTPYGVPVDTAKVNQRFSAMQNGFGVVIWNVLNSLIDHYLDPIKQEIDKVLDNPIVQILSSIVDWKDLVTSIQTHLDNLSKTIVFTLYDFLQRLLMGTANGEGTIGQPLLDLATYIKQTLATITRMIDDIYNNIPFGAGHGLARTLEGYLNKDPYAGYIDIATEGLTQLGNYYQNKYHYSQGNNNAYEELARGNLINNFLSNISLMLHNLKVSHPSLTFPTFNYQLPSGADNLQKIFTSKLAPLLQSLANKDESAVAFLEENSISDLIATAANDLGISKTSAGNTKYVINLQTMHKLFQWLAQDPATTATDMKNQWGDTGTKNPPGKPDSTLSAVLDLLAQQTPTPTNVTDAFAYLGLPPNKTPKQQPSQLLQNSFWDEFTKLYQTDSTKDPSYANGFKAFWKILNSYTIDYANDTKKVTAEKYTPYYNNSNWKTLNLKYDPAKFRINFILQYTDPFTHEVYDFHIFLSASSTTKGNANWVFQYFYE